MTVDEIVAAQVANIAVSEPLMSLAISQVEQEIKNYCNIDKVPEELKFTWASMAVDFLRYQVAATSSSDDNSTFDATFELDSSTKATIEDSLQAEGTVSCIQHDYIDNTRNPIVLFKNKFTVNAKILTYYKLSNEEIKDLKQQVQQALRLK